VFNIGIDNTTYPVYYLVIREENNGSLGTISVQGDSLLTTGGAGNNFMGLNTTVVGQSTYIPPTSAFGPAVDDNNGWDVYTVSGTVSGAVCPAVNPDANGGRKIKILGATTTASDNVLVDFQCLYSAIGTGGSLHLENVRLATATLGSVDGYALYTKQTIVTMSNVEIDGYSGDSGQTGGGAMRIRSTDYTIEGHDATNPSLSNVSVTNCCRGFRIQDSQKVYVKDCSATDMTDNAFYFASGSYTSAAGCTDSVFDSCTATNAGQTGFMNIGGWGNAFKDIVVVGSRGVGFYNYNSNSNTTVTGATFTNANTYFTVTPWGGSTDDANGAAIAQSVEAGDTSAALHLYNVVVNSGGVVANDGPASIVLYNSGPGTIEAHCPFVWDPAEFPGGLTGGAGADNITVCSTAMVTLFEQVGGTSSTGATNAWQTITKPTSYETYNAKTVGLFMYNTGIPVNVVLDIYTVETDPTSANPSVRFAGQTVLYTTPPVSVTTLDTTYVEQVFNIGIDNTTYPVYYIVIREENNGSLGSISIQGDSSLTTGGAGNNFMGLNTTVVGQSTYIPLPNAMVTLLEQIEGTSSTGATNAWQTITKPSPYETYNAKTVSLFMYNTGIPVNVVLDIYTVETDPTSANPSVRFAGQTVLYTTPPVSVTTLDTTYVEQVFNIGVDNTTYPVYYIVIREENSGSLGSISIQGDSLLTTGGSGNNFMGLNTTVVGQSTYIPPLNAMVTLLEQIEGTSSTGATNAWQTITKPSPYETYNAKTVSLFMYNTGTAISVVLDIYTVETDPTSANPSTRFAGQTVLYTTPPVSVTTLDTTYVEQVFDIGVDNTTYPIYYIVIREENNGSLGSISIQGDSSLTTGGAGNNFMGLNTNVVGQSTYIPPGSTYTNPIQIGDFSRTSAIHHITSKPNPDFSETDTTINETELGIYNLDGIRLDTNDDGSYASPHDLKSKLDFTPINIGTYLIALGGFDTTFGSENWSVTSNSSESGLISLIINNIVEDIQLYNSTHTLSSGAIKWFSFNVIADGVDGGGDNSPVTIIDRVSGLSNTGATNAWQTITKPNPYEAYNVSSISLFMYNTGSPVNVVLEIYAAESDPSSANPNDRFSSNDLVHTTSALNVSTPDTNFLEYEFAAQIDNTSITTFYVVLKEENGGSLGSITIQTDSSFTDGGAGNNYTGLNMIIKAEDISGDGGDGGEQNSEIEIYSVTSGGSETGHYSNAWQQITKPSPYESYNITSIKMFLSSTSGTGYLDIYDSFTQEHASASERFNGLTPVATSNTVNLANETIFDFPDGTTLTNNPPYYFNLIVASGASGSNIVFDYSTTPTTGGSGGANGILNHVIYGVEN
jgi:hypothetical protein